MRKGIYKATIFLLLQLCTILANAEFKVIGYFPNWTSMSPATIQFDKLTHINYAFVTPKNDGTLAGMATKNDSTKLRTLVQYAHAQNVKVLISIGGFNGSGGFVPVGNSASLRTGFTKNVLDLVKAFNLDGADIDWEFPASSTEATNCHLLMKELTDTLHKYNKLSTMAVNPYGTYADYILSDIFDYVDWMNIMAYDGGTPHSTMGMATSAITYWKNRGLSAEKIILGVPFYGRNSSGIVAYKTLVAADDLAPYLDYVTYNGKNTDYNGIKTIKDKTKLALEKAGGIMIWELSNDTNDETSLLKAIASQIPVTSTSEKITEAEFSIYPNPANSQLQFNLNSALSNSISELYISDISGKRILNINYANEAIDINELEEGFYIITLVSGNKIGQQKLIISRK